MNAGKLLLTSTGLSSGDVLRKFTSLVSSPEGQAVAIITTASEGKENNKYSQLARDQFLGVGFVDVDFVDLEADPLKDLSGYRVIYVCGGNTFKLLKFARLANFGESVKRLLSGGGVYVGVSAGSIIVGPSVQSALEIDGDPNDVGLEDFTGLNITDLIVLPHYSPELEREVAVFEGRHHVRLERLADTQAILIQDGERLLVG